MKLRTVFLSLVTLTIGIATGAMIAQVRPVEERVNEVARAAHPIPLIANLDPATRELYKRADKIWTFGGYKTKKGSGIAVRMQAEFNETAGSSWCNEIDGVGKGSARDNYITAAHADSHEGYTNPGPEDRPPEYMCFFYESRGKCDPNDGHAEYVESVPGPKGVHNDTQFITEQYKYISWGCQWHPKNTKCDKGDHGTGHKPGETCKRD